MPAFRFDFSVNRLRSITNCSRRRRGKGGRIHFRRRLNVQPPHDRSYVAALNIRAFLPRSRQHQYPVAIRGSTFAESGRCSERYAGLLVDTQHGLLLDWSWISGTSMSSPHVAGVAALIRQIYPKLSPEAVAARIRESATSMPCPTDWPSDDPRQCTSEDGKRHSSAQEW